MADTNPRLRRRPAPPVAAERPGERLADEPTGRRAIPPVVYLPVSPAPAADQGVVPLVELRRLGTGETALLAYTALDRLVDGLGPHQPWTLHETARLGEIEQRSPFDVVLFDQRVPAEVQHGGAR
ncbi:SAV_915 family protein [Nocardioides sp.]|uniref:SAV_915 family protein n=1 Tax=Nocardioides sp. TaxID=35761 RepID=UPI002715CA1F|nr:SAV_915 family protein [Nocardioides sp.]MDO9455157.1 hypothetical protein [Nocardioides sp.]